MVFVGGLIAAVLAVAAFVSVGKIVPDVRQRLAAAMLVGSVALLSTGGFYISESIGYLILGGALAAVALLLGFDAGA